MYKFTQQFLDKQIFALFREKEMPLPPISSTLYRTEVRRVSLNDRPQFVPRSNVVSNRKVNEEDLDDFYSLLSN